MRPMVAALALAFGMITDLALASVYVPGQYRNGIYVRPHFVASPERNYKGSWPAEALKPPAAEAEKMGPPVLNVRPPTNAPSERAS